MSRHMIEHGKQTYDDPSCLYSISDQQNLNMRLLQLSFKFIHNSLSLSVKLPIIFWQRLTFTYVSILHQYPLVVSTPVYFLLYWLVRDTLTITHLLSLIYRCNSPHQLNTPTWARYSIAVLSVNHSCALPRNPHCNDGETQPALCMLARCVSCIKSRLRLSVELISRELSYKSLLKYFTMFRLFDCLPVLGSHPSLSSFGWIHWSFMTMTGSYVEAEPKTPSLSSKAETETSTGKYLEHDKLLFSDQDKSSNHTQILIY